MVANRDNSKLATLLVCQAVLETVKEAGEYGAPASSLYLAFQSHNINYDAFRVVMDLLVRAGRLRLSNHVYYYVEN